MIKRGRVAKVGTAKIENTKESIFKFERNNFGAVLFAKSGNFWVARENSALFLTRVLGAQVKVKPDYDKYVDRNVICVPVHMMHFGKLIKHVEEKKCKVHAKDNLAYIKMPEEIAPDVIRKWRVDEEAMKVKIDSYFMPDVGDTRLYERIRQLGREVIIAERRMSNNMKGTVGDVLFGYVVEMERMYRGVMDKNIERRDAQAIVGDISFAVMIAHDEKVIQDKNAMRIGRILKDIARLTK